MVAERATDLSAFFPPPKAKERDEPPGTGKRAWEQLKRLGNPEKKPPSGKKSPKGFKVQQ